MRNARRAARCWLPSPWVSHTRCCPCGAKLILRSGDTQVLTEVIDNALVEPGRQLEVTEELASILGIDGTVELEWRFAASGSS